MKLKTVFFAFVFFSRSLLLSGQTNEGLVSVKDVIPEVTEHIVQNNVPELLTGIWQGSDRLVMFSNENEFALVLRVFYQWYNDRTSEPASFNELKTRDRNNTTISPSQEIEVKFITIVENPSKTAGVYELLLKYPSIKEKYIIPVCVIDGKLFLDFLIKDSAQITDLRYMTSIKNEQENSSGVKDGFYRSASNASGVTVAAPVFKKEVSSFFIHENSVYKIRYWLSEMEYSYAQASFSDGSKVFSVDKYLRIGDKVYQCTTGRSSKIRNIERSSDFGKETTTDRDGGIVAFGKPYLLLVPDKKSKEDFIENVRINNTRRKPAPKPLFPPSEIDFHWKDISELEKYNPYTWNRRNLDIHK